MFEYKSADGSTNATNKKTPIDKVSFLFVNIQRASIIYQLIRAEYFLNSSIADYLCKLGLALPLFLGFASFNPTNGMPAACQPPIPPSKR